MLMWNDPSLVSEDDKVAPYRLWSMAQLELYFWSFEFSHVGILIATTINTWSSSRFQTDTMRWWLWWRWSASKIRNVHTEWCVWWVWWASQKDCMRRRVELHHCQHSFLGCLNPGDLGWRLRGNWLGPRNWSEGSTYRGQTLPRINPLGSGSSCLGSTTPRQLFFMYLLNIFGGQYLAH